MALDTSAKTCSALVLFSFLPAKAQTLQGLQALAGSSGSRAGSQRLLCPAKELLADISPALPCLQVAPANPKSLTRGCGRLPKSAP